jgi:hypothetical protein
MAKSLIAMSAYAPILSQQLKGANLGRFRNQKLKVDGKSLESRKSMASHSKVSLEVNKGHVLMELSTTKDVSTSISVEQYIYQ